MIVIGLVGRIGAGKSTVARALAGRGAAVIDADRLAHEVLATPEVVTEVVARFGAGVLDETGHVRRSALAGKVFGPTPGHEAALRELEAIVHPRVRSRIEARLEALATAGTRVAVLDVPLLMQAGWDGLCDRLIAVSCDEEARRRRLDARGWPRAERDARERAWERGYRPPPPEKTLVVDASGDEAYTRAQAERVLDAAMLP